MFMIYKVHRVTEKSPQNIAGKMHFSGTKKGTFQANIYVKNDIFVFVSISSNIPLH